MTSIHARIPMNLKDDVLEAKRRGETWGSRVEQTFEDRPRISRKVASASKVIMKRPTKPVYLTLNAAMQSASAPVHQSTLYFHEIGHEVCVDEDVDEASESKENDPSLSPSPVLSSRPRRPELKKRPLSDLPTPTEEEMWKGGLSPSEMNSIANERTGIASNALSCAKPQIGYTLVERSQSSNLCNIDRRKDDPPAKRLCSDEYKENVGTARDPLMAEMSHSSTSGNNISVMASGIAKDGCVSNKASKAKSAKARVGLRRL